MPVPGRSVLLQWTQSRSFPRLAKPRAHQDGGDHRHDHRCRLECRLPALHNCTEFRHPFLFRVVTFRHLSRKLEYEFIIRFLGAIRLTIIQKFAEDGMEQSRWRDRPRLRWTVEVPNRLVCLHIKIVAGNTQGGWGLLGTTVSPTFSSI